MSAEDQGSGTPPSSKSPRFRSPPYPAIDLKKAVERLGELYRKALHHKVPLAVLADAWAYEEKSSGLAATIAALKQYGLITDEGLGDKRRFQLTDRALRVARDPDLNSVARLEAIKKSALAPKIFSELWDLYGVSGVSGALDVALKSHLVVGRVENGESPFSEKAAEQLIDDFKSTIAFAGLVETVLDEGKLEAAKPGDGAFDQLLVANPKPPKVGDLVQWESEGGAQFEKPVRVRALQAFEGQEFVFVDGEETGFPIGQIVVVESAKAASAAPLAPRLPLARPERQRREGITEEATHVREGEVTLLLPEKLSAESFDEIEAWLDYILVKHARRAGVERGN